MVSTEESRFRIFPNRKHLYIFGCWMVRLNDYKYRAAPNGSLDFVFLFRNKPNAWNI